MTINHFINSYQNSSIIENRGTQGGGPAPQGIGEARAVQWKIACAFQGYAATPWKSMCTCANAGSPAARKIVGFNKI